MGVPDWKRWVSRIGGGQKRWVSRIGNDGCPGLGRREMMGVPDLLFGAEIQDANHGCPGLGASGLKPSMRNAKSEKVVSSDVAADVWRVGSGQQRGAVEAGGFVQAEHDIHRLHCLAGGALYQVVDAHHDHQRIAPPGLLQRNAAVVGTTHRAGLGILTGGQHIDEGLVGIALLKQLNPGHPSFGAEIQDANHGCPRLRREK